MALAQRGRERLRLSTDLLLLLRLASLRIETVGTVLE